MKGITINNYIRTTNVNFVLEVLRHVHPTYQKMLKITLSSVRAFLTVTFNDKNLCHPF